MKKICAVFNLTKNNMNSFNALAGAVEETPEASDIELFFAKNNMAFLRLIKENYSEYDVVAACFSFTTLHLIESIKSLQLLKQTLKQDGIHNVITVAGGSHTTGSPAESLYSGFDYVVKGEGEYVFPALLNAFRYEQEPLDIKGVYGLCDGLVAGSGMSRKVDIDKFSGFTKKYGRYSYLEITRGCPVACRYCQTSYLFGGKFRHRSVDNICSSIEFLVELGTKDFLIISPDSLSYGAEQIGAPDLAKIENLLINVKKVIKDRKFYFGAFPAELWSASVTKDGLELLKKYSHNKNVVIGAQTGSDRMLDILGRKHSRQDVVNAVELAVKAGFEPHIDFIFGFPEETEEDQLQTVELMKNLAALGGKIHSHSFIPLAGTPLGRSKPAEPSGLLIDGLEKLTGEGQQYGTWKTQLDKAKAVYAFRKTINETKDVEKSLLAAENFKSIF